MSVSVSLPESVRQPQSFGWPVRIGHWQDETDFSSWIEAEGFDGVIDAGDPFSTEVSFWAESACLRLGIDHARFLPPFWVPADNDRWVFLNHAADAMQHVTPGSSVLAVLSRQNIECLTEIECAKVYWRVWNRVPSEHPLNNGKFSFSFGTPSVASEIQALQDLDIDWIIVENMGGQEGRALLDAARELGVNVAMLRRPKQPDGLKIHTVAEVLAWVRRRM